MKKENLIIWQAFFISFFVAVLLKVFDFVEYFTSLLFDFVWIGSGEFFSKIFILLLLITISFFVISFFPHFFNLEKFEKESRFFRKMFWVCLGIVIIIYALFAYRAVIIWHYCGGATNGVVSLPLNCSK
jgi:hypothetical protein